MTDQWIHNLHTLALRPGPANGLKAWLLPFLEAGRREQLEAVLQQSQPLGLLVLCIRHFVAFEKVYGEEISAHFLGLVEQSLNQVAIETLGESGLLFVEKLEAGTFAVLFTKNELALADLPELAAAFRLSFRNHLNREVVKVTGQRLDIQAGCALIPGQGGLGIERSLYHALCDARDVASGHLDPVNVPLLEEFRDLVDTPRLTMVYQPIVDFRTGGVLGWESLVRGPEGGRFRSPMVLFDFAEEVGSLFSLEKACREQSIRNLGPFAQHQKLFLNIHPRTLTDPHFSPGETLRLLEKYNLSPHNVVFEITERHSIAEFTLFHRTLDHYRKQGYQVAVDDVGTGYSGLLSIAEIRPDFIKVDMSLIRGIDANPIKRALMETMVAFSDKIGCGVIAEGIETKTEMTSLVSMGVPYGQGFHLARPAFPKPQPNPAPYSAPAVSVRSSGEWKCSIPIQDLVEPTQTIGPDEEVRMVRRVFETGEPISGVVVVEDERPVGLLMSHHLDRRLGTQYGVALFYRRAIRHVMDDAPLIVDGQTPVEQVGKMAMKRESYKIYDHIVVTRGGRLAGVVSVQKMLDTMARVQVEMAKGANPLTGLPGNLAIENEMERRRCFQLATSLIYVDLDHFKIYNDYYGFKDGDRVLLLLGRILAYAVRRHGLRDDFVGHVGGDDFVMITTPARAERISQSVVRCFGRLIGRCYKEEDRQRGVIPGKDRKGREGDFPMISVSLAIVDRHGEMSFDLIQRRAAEMKHYAKTLPGNKFVRDRRGPASQADVRPFMPEAKPTS